MPTLLERRYCRQHLHCVRHITLDPKGRGVVRIHMLPPREDNDNAPFLLLLNGSKLVPLNLSWAILLASFMDKLEPFAGLEISESDWRSMAAGAVAETRKVYPFTPRQQLADDLETMITSLVAIARGQEPEAEIAPLSLGEYAREMTAPHRMDLMISAMTRGGQWHCNQKCLHCYAAGQPLSDTAELTTAQWKQVLDTLRRIGVPQVTFTGGEPTLRADLVELVDAAQWFVSRLNTNGRLLTPELCRQLCEASLDSVQVTLYSADPAIHNALVGAAGFDDTVAGIRSAVAAGRTARSRETAAPPCPAPSRSPRRSTAASPPPRGPCPPARSAPPASPHGESAGETAGASPPPARRRSAHSPACGPYRSRVARETSPRYTRRYPSSHSTSPYTALAAVPNTITGPATVNILTAVPVISPSARKSMAGEATALAKPVMGTSVPAPAYRASR